MRIACTGFLSEQTGSIAGANALLLRSLLEEGVELISFRSPPFVDPRPVAAGLPGFRFFSTVNAVSDGLRRQVSRVPLLSFLAARLDSVRYNHLLVKHIREEHCHHPYDLCLWMGAYAGARYPEYRR